MARQGFPFGSADYGYLGSGYETGIHPSTVGRMITGPEFETGPGFYHEPNPAWPVHLPENFPRWWRPIHIPKWTHPVQLGVRTTNWIIRLVNGLPTYTRRY